MKIYCEQSALLKAFNTVSKAVSSKSTIPVLKGVLLEAKDQNLILSASDLDISIERVIRGITVEEEGKLVVQAKLFGDIIRKLPGGEILLEEKEDNGLIIRNASTNFTIVTQSAEEFPKAGEFEEDAVSFVFDKDILKDMIRRSSFSASIDESKGVIVGELIEIGEKEVNMIALDGFRMAIIRQVIENGAPGRLIVSAKILNEIEKIFSETETKEKEKEKVKIFLNNKKAVLLMKDIKIVVRLLEGDFIKYRDILPKDYKCTVKVYRNILLDAIERAALLAKEGKNNLIKLSTSENVLTITSKSDEGTVKEEVFIKRGGTDLEIGFNSKYLLDVLKVIDDEEIFLNFNLNVNPCIIKPVEGNGYEYLILPVRITGN